MNILVTINKDYIKQLNVLLKSIELSNKKDRFDIYLFHKSLTELEIDKVKNGLDMERFCIISIQIPQSEIDTFPVYQKRYPVEIYFRIFATKYLPNNLERILYLDSDIIVINELKELYEKDFEGNYYIAATHVNKVLHKINEIRLDLKKEEPYINTGVLLINLKQLRTINIEKEVIDFVNKNKSKLILPDQDIISAVYGDKIKVVDEFKYNLGDRSLYLYNIKNPNKKISLKWICKNTVIIHYYGKNKPWKDKYVGKLGFFYKRVKKKILKEKMNIPK